MASVMRKRQTPYIIFGAVGLLILLPLLGPGYILTLDMAFTPQIRLPDEIGSSYLFYAVLHILNLVIPGDLLQKALLLSILLLSGSSMFLLVRYVQQTVLGLGGVSAHEIWGATLGGVLYMMNPFTYSRFMAGQFAVLLGYALLPFFLRSLLRFLASPSIRQAACTSVWIAVIGILSIHTLGLVAVIGTLFSALFIWQHPRAERVAHALQTLRYGLCMLGIAAFLSSYWLIPLILGNGSTAEAISGFSRADQQAFATTGDYISEKVLHVLMLQGFWADQQGQYRLPSTSLLWSIGLAGLWATAAYGGVKLWQSRHRLFLTALTGSACIALIIAATPAMYWLEAYLPLVQGAREPHKFTGIIVLAVVLCAGVGAAALLRQLARPGQETAQSLAKVGWLFLPVLLTPTMLFGFNGQLKAVSYPSDWIVANKKMNQGDHDSKALFLPWHLYMHFDFNNRLAVNPAESFFDKTTVTSNQLEFRGASPTRPDPQKDAIGDILARAPTRTDLGNRLQPFGIEYIILAKDQDYRTYDYLKRQPDLLTVLNTDTIRIYKNKAYKGGE